MSIDPNHQAPPPYEPPVPPETAMQTLIDRVQNTVNREYGNQDEDPDETKRLREFILYCLAVDYRVRCSVQLSASDREHYLQVCEVIWATERMERPKIVTAKCGASESFGPYLWKYLHASCMRLGDTCRSCDSCCPALCEVHERPRNVQGLRSWYTSQQRTRRSS